MLSTKPFTAYCSTYPYVFWDNFFTEEELTRMELYFDTQKLVEGGIGGTNENNKVTRITSVAFIPANDENSWIFNRLMQMTEFINTQFYNYDLIGFDYLQYTVYDKVGSHYSYHMDMTMGGDQFAYVALPPRKLSFSLILSEREDFEGGDLEFKMSDDPVPNPEQKRGRVIAFPSFMLHRVTPVTQGIRKSLVFWACGPKFK